MLRVAQLGEQERRRQLGHAVAETHQEPPALEHGKILRSTLDGRGNDHDRTTKDDRDFAAEAVAKERTEEARQSDPKPGPVRSSHLHNRQTGDGTDAVESGQETEIGSLRIVEVSRPLRENTNVVQHGSISQLSVFASSGFFVGEA